MRLLLIMVLMESSLEYDSNGGHIIKIDENHPWMKFWAQRAVICCYVAHITSFLTETIGKF